MSNVIEFDFSRPKPSHTDANAALTQCFARHRRISDDVFWLKENAELLNIHETAGLALGDEALSAYASFYNDAENRLRFFPQYYRFFLSIALDLEALGIGGTKAEELCAWAHERKLAEAELSDLQRAEAARLLARGGIGEEDPQLAARMRRFISHSETFSLPNKKAAYELTHIVFYLSEYGRKDPELTGEAIRSLMFAGTLAFIDENADLLAEVCVALRFAGQAAPKTWEIWLSNVRKGVTIQASSGAPIDDYHAYFILNWHAALSGGSSFEDSVNAERTLFFVPKPQTGVLRSVSEYLYNMADQRVGDWQSVRPDLEGHLGEIAFSHLTHAETAYDEFGEFFELFARASR